MVIRRGGRQDVRFLRDMLHHAYYWRERSPGDGPGPAARYVKGWGRPGDTVLIAIDDAFPVGAAWYRLFRRDQPGYGFVDEETPELAIAVVPSRRGRGIGEALLEALCERARADGYEALSLSVERGNEALVSFYESHGFARVEGGDEHSVTMRRELSAAGASGEATPSDQP
jgi:ribosomal protein S18 acetylase RimI-like enzyme